MTTRAANIEFLLSGLSSSTTGLPVAGGTVYFYEAGTTTQKYVWTEITKTNGYYSYDLDAVGAAQLYGEGNYKIVVKDSSGATVCTLDNIRLEYPYYGVRSVVGGGGSPITQRTQDDIILVDTSAASLTINCLAASLWTRPLKFMRISGSNTFTIDPSNSETIDGSSTLVVSDDSIVEVISDGSNLRTAGFRSSTTSPDGGSAITVGDGSITMDVDDTQDVMVLYGSGAYTVYASGGLSVTSGGLYVSGGISVSGGLTVSDDITQSSGSVFTGGTVYPTTLKVNEDVALTPTSTEINSGCDGMGVSIPRQKIVEIGDWNMDSTASVTVAHGLTLAKIVGLRGLVRNDAATAHHPIAMQSLYPADVQLRVSSIDGTNVNLTRETGSVFDDTAFDATSYNRGWIILDYID